MACDIQPVKLYIEDMTTKTPITKSSFPWVGQSSYFKINTYYLLAKKQQKPLISCVFIVTFKRN